MRSNYWRKGSIFATFFICCIIIVLLSASLATDYWVQSSAKRNSTQELKAKSGGNINFGLFNGEKVLNVGIGERKYIIRVVCLKEENVCMYSCGTTAGQRQADLSDLVYGNGSGWDQDEHCKGTSVSASAGRVRRELPPPGGPDIPGLLTQQLDTEDEDQLDVTVTEMYQSEPEFMIYGLWMATIATMGASILFALIAAVFAVLNTATNPVETITGVIGLYIWNSIAMFFELVTLILWGVQFHKTLSHSVLWRREKLNHWTTDGLASLGYSYWLVFVAIVLHACNIAILWWGTKQHQPKKVQIPVERGNTNAINMIY